MEPTLTLIQKFQQEGDREALSVLFNQYLPLIEQMVEQYDQSTLGKEVALEKARERFPFIIGKYQLSVQMPIETFLANTFRLFFRSL